jgi:ABC-type antimicrobial peptide transport system permease subunit
MNLFRLRLKSLFYHWRGNLAVFLGVVVGTAVLTGALLVGDSLRGSLRQLTLQRLEWVDQSLVAPRFFREELFHDLDKAGAADRMCPAILLQATAMVEGHENQPRRQVRRVTVMGVDGHFWGSPDMTKKICGADTQVFNSSKDALWVNSTLARDLNVQRGEEVTLRFQKPSTVPRETPLAAKEADALVDDLPLSVTLVLDEGCEGDRFSLQPGLEAPRIAYVPLSHLQSAFGWEGRINAMLVGGAKGSLKERLENSLTLDDWGLTLHDSESRVHSLFDKLDHNHNGKLERNEYRDRLAESFVKAVDREKNGVLTRQAVEEFYRTNRNYLSLESTKLLLEPAVAETALDAAKAMGLRAAPTLVYLANGISDGKETIPYSVVAALDPSQPPPLGPFLPPGVKKLSHDQIVLADWKESPLKAKAGDEITLTYFAPEYRGEPKERSVKFRLAGFIPLEGVAADPDLTPEFPGITDKLNLAQWNPPFPYDNSRVQPRDEHYWKEYRTTPKAYVTLAAGQKLWGSRFGQLTSIRLAAKDGDVTKLADVFRRNLLAHLPPERGGFVFEEVKKQALQASSGGTDFAGLFLGFSFFLILAALLLVGLLFRLNLDRRASEIGLLLAAGYRRGTVRWLLATEGGFLATVGAAVGCAVAMLYADLLLKLLGALWPDAVLRSFLRPHFTWASLGIGFVASLVVSELTILWAVRVLGKVAPSALLAGQTTSEREPGQTKQPRWSWWIAGVSVVAAAALLLSARWVTDHEMRAMTFFGSGSLLLTACLASMWAWMRSTRHRTVDGHGAWAVARLGVRNAARHPVRSLLTAGLLASAAFLLVAVEAFRRRADAHDNTDTSPSGGFALLAESDLPLFKDLNSEEGRQELLDKLLVQFRDQLKGDNAKAQERVREAEVLLKQVTVYAFRVRAGDDASCLNLYQPRRPRLLGVPASLTDRPRFAFAETIDRQQKNPWKILERKEGDIPAFGEKNTVEWMLKSGLGKVFPVPDEKGQEQPLLIAGLLQDSIFQSGLLLSEENFLRLYPGHEGYNFFLLQVPAGQEAQVKMLLETGLADRGFEVTPTAERLESFLAVENTYLSTFQALGGLGLVLGSLGLAVVLLRGVWERRAELALLRALGFRRVTLGWLVLAENGFLLLLGLGAGAASALLAVAPHLLGEAGSIPWTNLLLLFALVLVVGLTAGAFAVAGTLRAPLVPALRRE